MKVDFSYKDNPLKVTYDIEATPSLFTLAMIHDYAMTLIIFGRFSSTNARFCEQREKYENARYLER